MDIKIGSIVILNSGGPEMTVVEILEEEIVCTWFEKGKQKFGRFPKEAIKSIE